jgi:hypothetical protein
LKLRKQGTKGKGKVKNQEEIGYTTYSGVRVKTPQGKFGISYFRVVPAQFGNPANLRFAYPGCQAVVYNRNVMRKFCKIYGKWVLSNFYVDKSIKIMDN